MGGLYSQVLNHTPIYLVCLSPAPYGVPSCAHPDLLYYALLYFLGEISRPTIRNTPTKGGYGARLEDPPLL